MESLTHRFASFSAYPGYGSPAEISSAGFYYFGQGFLCKCFHCGIITTFASTEDPWKKHVHVSPLCQFVESTKGKNFTEKNASTVVFDQDKDFTNISGDPSINQYRAWCKYQLMWGINHNETEIDGPGQNAINARNLREWQVTKQTDKMVKKYALDKKIVAKVHLDNCQ